MTKVRKGRGYVYSIQYHIVWCTKHRQDILIDEVDDSLKEIINKIAQDNDFEIEELATDVDHIHLLISCSPQHSIPNMLKALKGVSARLLFLKHKELKKSLWSGSLWNPSYFIVTVSENTEEQIRDYINNQKEGE